MAETKFIKTEKKKNYTVIDNTFIQDPRLSWKAKGVMTYFLSLPGNWEVHFSEIETHANDGRSSLRTAINELKQFGYLRVQQCRSERNRFGEMVYVIIESPLTDFPQAEKPQAEKPQAENRTLQNTNNTKYLNIQSTNSIKASTALRADATPAIRNAFKTPSLEEIKNYIAEIGVVVDAQRFYDYYESNGWKVGRNSMKDWKATVRNWGRRNEKSKYTENVIVDENYFNGGCPL